VSPADFTSLQVPTPALHAYVEPSEVAQTATQDAESSLPASEHVRRAQFLKAAAASTSAVPSVAQWIYATHFEATDARTAFPCFDEPQLKASFEATLLAPAAMNTYFGTPEVLPRASSSIISFGGRSIVVPDGWSVRKYARTPTVMSTYLVAYGFGYTDEVSFNGPHSLPMR
jgi:aminopeptidase N